MIKMAQNVAKKEDLLFGTQWFYRSICKQTFGKRGTLLRTKM